MRNRKVALFVIIAIIITILLVCLVMILHNTYPIEWIMEKIISSRLFRYSVVISFQDMDDVDCMNKIFESMDIEVKSQHILDNKSVEYALASEYPLPDGWLDRFSYKEEIELYDSYKNRVIYSSDIDSMSYSINFLTIQMKDEYQIKMADYYDESFELFFNGQWMDCNIYYQRDTNAYELISKKAKNEQLETVLIDALVSFYSYPICSSIVITYQ